MIILLFMADKKNKGLTFVFNTGIFLKSYAAKI